MNKYLLQAILDQFYNDSVNITVKDFVTRNGGREVFVETTGDADLQWLRCVSSKGAWDIEEFFGMDSLQDLLQYCGY